MSKIVTALFISRSEAEAAQARLWSRVKVESVRVIGPDTKASLLGLPIEANELESLSKGLKRGKYVVVAIVPQGSKLERIVAVLNEPTVQGPPNERPKPLHSIANYLRGRPAREREIDLGVGPAAYDLSHRPPMRVPNAEGSALAARPALDAQGQPQETVPPVLERGSSPTTEVASVAESSVKLRASESQSIRARGPIGPVDDGHTDFESQPSGRRLSDEEEQVGGFLTDRVIEVIEMREQPVVTREGFVREEVLIRKSVSQRSDIVHDTARRNEVEIEELRAGDCKDDQA